MVKTSKGVILSQASQIKSDYSFALIKATADNKSLVQDASSAELKVNALVEYSKDSQWDPKKLTSLGFPAGCFLIVDLRGQDIHAADLITNLALVRQYGYQAGVIDDLSTLDDIKALKDNQIYLINSGKTNDDQDASLNGNEITDGSGKLTVGMSVKWQRDYTNVDVSGDHAGFVGMGQDTLLKGGKGFGYSTNGKDFNTVISPKGIIFRRADAERMWRLLRPKEINDIDMTVNDRVKKMVDSATAEIPQAVSNANKAVKKADSAVVNSKVNSDAIVAQSEAISEAKAAMDRATAEIQNAVKESQKEIDNSIAQINSDIEQDRKEIASAQQANADTAKQLDTYSKQAQDQGKTIKLIQDKQDGFTATLADVQGNVTQVFDKVDGLSTSLKDAQDNVASVKVQADQLSATLTDHTKNIATMTASAKKLSSTMEDADGRLSKVEQTATGTQQTVANQQDQINSIQTDVSGIHETITGQGNQIATINTSLNGLNTKYESVSGDLGKLKDQVNSTQITQNQQAIALKADQTEVNQIKNTASQNSSRLDVMAGQISSKVTATDVNNIVDSKGYATTSTVQSLITQKAGTINESITSLDSKYNTTVTQVQSLTASIDGLQSTVANKADQSKITQLANALQVKLSGSIIAQATDVTLTYTGAENEYPPAAPLVGMNDVDKGSTLILSFDYVASADTKFNPQLDGEPWIPWGSIDNGTPAANGEKGSYSKTITVNDDSWQNGNAKNLCIRCDGFKGTIEITNLVLKYADTTLNDAQSSFDMLRDDINLRVQKGDLISQLNMEAGQTLIQSKKLFLDADTIVFSKNSKAFIPDAVIENLSLDKLTTGHITVPIADKYGNQIELGNDGINISSAPQTVRWSNAQTKSNDEARFMINVAGKGIEFIDHVKYDPSVEHINKSDDFSFLRMQPDVLHSQDGSADQVVSPSGMTLYVPINISPETGPVSPGGFLAVGYDETQQRNPSDEQDEQKGIDIAYVAKPINGWEKGLTINTTMRMKPKGADHGIRTAWVSWSNWDGGEKYPALVQDGSDYWGGIAFPKSGRVTLFDAYGRYYSPDKNTLVGPYNDYGG